MKYKLIVFAFLLFMANKAFSQSTNTYEYDNLNRLTKVTYANGAVVQYTYDAVGNRLTKTVAGAYIQYTITATASPMEGGTITGGGLYDEGSDCTLTATANTGYTFTNWTKDGQQVSTSASYTFAVMENASYVANFTLNTYQIIASANPSNGGTVSGGGSYNHGSSCTLMASPNTGYTFTNWTKDGQQVSTSATYSFTVTESGNYVANFSQNSYTISASASPSNGGMVSGGGSYNHGSSCTLTASPNTGYTFTNWTKDGQQVSTSAIYSFTVTESGNYVANFSQNSYTISASASPSNGGTVSGGGSYNHGSSCTLTATANTGYTFTNWTENGTQVSASTDYSFIVTENRTLVANFEEILPNTYVITASANPSEGGTVSGSGSYTEGGTCILTATANEGYAFTSWTRDGQEVSTSATYSFIVTENASYMANFTNTLGDYHWAIEGNQFAGTMTAVGVIQINGEEQTVATLELGAFCSGQCRGRERLSYVSQLNRYLLFLTLYGNDGDLLSFRLYDHSLGQELDLTCTSTLTFATNGSMGTSTNPYAFNFIDGLTQTTSLSEGWNWWNCYVDLDGIDGLEQMKASLGDNGIMIKSRNDGFVINSYGMWLGQLSAVNNESTYLIQTSAACDMTITGNAATPSAHPITLSPGWNWIGYPCTTPMSVSDAMSGLTPMADDLLKSRESFAVYTPGIGWLGTLSTITPGMGLMFESHNTSPVTLTYPNPSKSEALLENITARDNHWEPEMQGYAQNMSVMATVELEGEELESGQYELAAFSNGECRGSAKLMYVEPIDKYMAFLTVYGEGGEELVFGLYDAMTGAETYESGESLVFEANAVVGAIDAPFVVRFGGLTGMDEFGRHIHLFPNPVRRGENVSIGMVAEDYGEVQIEVINVLGAVVSMETSTKQPVSIKAPDVAGAYTLRITVEGKGTCYRKLVVR
jgi:YD repeat-containing protein